MLFRTQAELDNADAYVQQFRQSYAVQNYGLAYEAFCNAMKADATYACRALIVPNGSVGNMAKILNKIDDITAMLDSAFVRHPEIHMTCENIPSQIEYVRHLRAENLAKGKPSVVLITLRKSGTITLANIFTSGLTLPSYAYGFLDLTIVDSWARDYARGGCCQVTQMRPDPKNIEGLKRTGLGRIIVHVRDPRQAIISRIHHIERYREAFPAYNNPEFFQLSMDEKLARCMDIYKEFVAWVEGWLVAAKSLDIFYSTFEDFITDRTAFTQRYLDFYGPHARDFDEKVAFAEHAGIDYHKRLGEIDEWRRVFSPENQRVLNALLPDSLKEHFGWKN